MATPATVAELVVAMIQLALTDNSFKADLRDQLELHGADAVRLVDVPDPEAEDILVLDLEHLRMLAAPIPHPERIVLVAGNRTEDMDHAWRAGLRSVVLRDDPIGTAVLAVLCTRLNLSGVENGNLEQKV